MPAMNRRSFLLLIVPAIATGCVSTGNRGKSPAEKEKRPPEGTVDTENAQSEQTDRARERHQAYLRRRRKARQLQLEKARKQRLEAARKRRRRLKAARDRRRRRSRC